MLNFKTLVASSVFLLLNVNAFAAGDAVCTTSVSGRVVARWTLHQDQRSALGPLFVEGHTKDGELRTFRITFVRVDPNRALQVTIADNDREVRDPDTSLPRTPALARAKVPFDNAMDLLIQAGDSAGHDPVVQVLCRAR